MYRYSVRISPYSYLYWYNVQVLEFQAQVVLGTRCLNTMTYILTTDTLHLRVLVYVHMYVSYQVPGTSTAVIIGLWFMLFMVLYKVLVLFTVCLQTGPRQGKVKGKR